MIINDPQIVTLAQIPYFNPSSESFPEFYFSARYVSGLRKLAHTIDF